LLLLVLLVGARAQQNGCPEVTHGLVPVAYEEIPVSTVAVGLNANTIQGASTIAAFCTVTGGPINYTFTGVPTATVGHEFDQPAAGNAGPTSGTWMCGKAVLLGFRAIRQGLTDATLHVSYFAQ
jgi:hypothetical protein